MAKAEIRGIPTGPWKPVELNPERRPKSIIPLAAEPQKSGLPRNWEGRIIK